MLTLKQLFKDKEKIKNTQITFERYHKSGEDEAALVIGLYILNGLLVLGYYIFTGKFVDTSPAVMIFLPMIMLMVELLEEKS